jgi:hypothetical protein
LHAASGCSSTRGLAMTDQIVPRSFPFLHGWLLAAFGGRKAGALLPDA